MWLTGTGLTAPRYTCTCTCTCFGPLSVTHLTDFVQITCHSALNAAHECDGARDEHFSVSPGGKHFVCLLETREMYASSKHVGPGCSSFGIGSFIFKPIDKWSAHACLLQTMNTCLLQTMNIGVADPGQLQFLRALDNPKVSRLTAPLLEQGFCSLSPRDSLALLACAASAKTSAFLIRWFAKQRWDWMMPAGPSGYCPKTRASTPSFCRFLWPLACLLTALMATRCRALRPQCVLVSVASPVLPTQSTPHARRHIRTVININTTTNDANQYAGVGHGPEAARVLVC